MSDPSKNEVEGPAESLCLGALGSLERTVELVGAPVTFKTGASEEELRALESAVGLCLPDEVRTLYRWHNGAEELVPGGRLLSTAEVATERAAIREYAPEAWQHTPQLRDLVPVFTEGKTLLMVSWDPAETATVYAWESCDFEPTPLYASLLHRVMLIEHAYLSRVFYADYDQWQWDDFGYRLLKNKFQPNRAAEHRHSALAAHPLVLDSQADPIERICAMNTVKYDLCSVPVLIQLLRDSDRDIVLRAAFGLGAMHVREAIPELLAMLDREPRIAADALANILTPEDTHLLSRLMPLLHDVEVQHRISALNALSALRSPAAVPTVIAALSDPEPGVLPYVIGVLARTRDKRALQPLRELRERVAMLGLDPVYRGGYRGSRMTPDILKLTIDGAIQYIASE